MRVFVPLTIRKRNGRPKIVPPADMAPDTGVVDPHVLKAIAKAWSWRRKLESGALATIEDVADAEGVTPAYIRRMLKLAYLAPVVLVGFTPIMLVAHPSANVASIKELTDAAKASPGKLGYASCGNGTPQNFAAELYQATAGVTLIHAPYRGCAPGLTDVLGGQVPLAALSANMVVPHLRNGRLKALALTSREKYRLTPEVPTMESLGFRDFDFANWYGIMGPAGLPKSVIDKITTDVMAVMAMPDVAANMSTAGIEKLIGNAGEFAEVIRADLAKYAQVAKRANIKAE
jgi:tripartite-type tricarboxylate transporter receptor subunit TctC